jgi:hypothetical protein
MIDLNNLYYLSCKVENEHSIPNDNRTTIAVSEQSPALRLTE